MLEIKKISKLYETEGFKQKALDGVSVSFRKCEFASILGPSGSGKTTFLNIIGGLDHYTSGDLIINGVSTKKYKEADWNSYRNHRIGFVFQSYNLITHQSILSNVRLALTLSGISKKESIERARKALKDVGLEHHMYKRPNQLSGGQMQRVAIARALVNNPDIILADEPTGALDSETSIQIMNLLKNIAKNKLVIMVTHNPDLAKEYSTRIITLKDGKITSDSNPYKESKDENKNFKDKKTSMSFLTALSLSFNNLMTKKGRTILVAFAGSIGIIGIALILAVSTGFQNYVDSIQEETLTSYPLTIMEEATDITGVLLSMRSGKNENTKSNKVVEQQYLTSMLSSVSTNDLKSFKKYIEENYDKVNEDLSTIKYSYSVEPNVYTIDATNKLAKLNPSNLFSSFMGGSTNVMMSSYSSIFSEMIDNQKTLDEQYEILSGRWPSSYNELVIVLSERNGISDLLVYSLGLRDTEELNKIIKDIMNGEKVNINNKPLEFTYEDLLNVKLKLIHSSDKYKYNSKYKVYEDMSDNESYMKNLYNKAEDLKVVGIVTQKEGITASALNPGIGYKKELTDYIIKYANEQEIVKKQLLNDEVDVLSNSKFDEKRNNFDFKFEDLVKVDNKKLQSAFNIKIDETSLKNQTTKYMNEISNSITTNTKPAKDAFNNGLNTLIEGLFSSIEDKISMNDIDTVTSNYMDSSEVNNILSNLEKNYVIPKSTLKLAYSGLLKNLLQAYIPSYYMVDPSLIEDTSNMTAVVNNDVKNEVVNSYISSAAINGVSEQMGKVMTEAVMKKTILTKVGELTTNLTNAFSKAFNVDPNKISSAFSLNFSEDELARVVSAMMKDTNSSAKTNLISFGYQDKEEPTYISFYFNSFDGKENFLKFIEDYNKKFGEEKEIRYTDTTGILMDSVKTIVNAVSYVLIAFVSISLVVSSIMIGIITYISVYERTKEIGILRSIGASKRNISSIFNAETFIIGLLSGIFGIGISYILIPIINLILHKYTGNIPLSATLDISSAFILIILSIILTLIGGLIPAKSAANKDPVEALRSE